MAHDLQLLVQQAQHYPQLLAAHFARYRERYQLSEEAFIELMGVQTQYDFQLLCLCYAPEIEASADTVCNWSEVLRWLHRYITYVHFLPETLIRILFMIAPNESVDIYSPISPSAFSRWRALSSLVVQARDYPQLLASTIAEYQAHHKLTLKDIMAYVRLPTQRVFHLLQLCDATNADRQLYIRCDRRAVKRIIQHAPQHLFWKPDSRGKIWTCRTTLYQARIAEDDYGTYWATVITPTQRIQAPRWYDQCEDALDWCEQTLDAMPVTAAIGDA
jgi:hypothetical protein